MSIQDPVYGLMPPAASTFAPDVDGIYELTLWTCAFFFFLILGILLYSIVRWRRRTPEQPAASAVTHNTTLEVAWTLIPLIIMMVFFAWGWKGSIDMSVAPVDSLQYQTKAKQWSWEIYHPGTVPGTDAPSVNEMWVPVNTPIKNTIYSEDVLHAFYVPAFRIKGDVIPGRYRPIWFEPTRVGDYDLFCAEYCGDGHSYMHGTVHVVTQEEFDKQPWNVVPSDPVEYGKQIYTKQCSICHTTDGTILIGPSWKGIWGSTAQLEGGATAVVDRDYVAESIRQPEAKRVAGFEGKNMTPFDFNDQQVDAVVAYLKTLK